MKNLFKNLAVLLGLVVMLSACSSSQSLQEYYVDNTENPNFLSFDIPTSFLGLAVEKLTPEEKKAVESIKKLNVLAFRKTGDNVAEYKAEKAKVKTILGNKKFNQLMKINTDFAKGVVKYIGTDDAIDEVIVYGDSDKEGFGLIRIIGNDMNPAHLGQLIKALEKADINENDLKGLGQLIGN